MCDTCWDQDPKQRFKLVIFQEDVRHIKVKIRKPEYSAILISEIKIPEAGALRGSSLITL